MFNKFIFSGLVLNVNMVKKNVSFTVPMPDGNGMLMEMTFNDEICKNVAELKVNNKNVVVNVEGFIIPSKEKGLDLVTTNVSTVVIPEDKTNVS